MGEPVATMFVDGLDPEAGVLRALRCCRSARELPYVEVRVAGGGAGEYVVRTGSVISGEVFLI